MKYDLIIKNGNVDFYDEVKQVDIAVKEGKISAIATKPAEHFNFRRKVNRGFERC
ncbi:hypothetical protein ACFFIX_14565 [Metabacillus herbersteinensis]|uniref:Amidohydrolase 3 domain-containing protein n=1 Tax=Metabacillus herbersteinensis TaxID=283816 RepID=A0ABV6GG41_9BACI